MTGIEPWISGAGSDRFGNCATTTSCPNMLKKVLSTAFAHTRFEDLDKVGRRRTRENQ